jgi:hypothetical protein
MMNHSDVSTIIIDILLWFNICISTTFSINDYIVHGNYIVVINKFLYAVLSLSPLMPILGHHS